MKQKFYINFSNELKNRKLRDLHFCSFLLLLENENLFSMVPFLIAGHIISQKCSVLLWWWTPCFLFSLSLSLSSSLRALIDHPGVLATPHLGASTAEAQLKVAKEVAQQFVAAVKGEGLMGVVCCHSNTKLFVRSDIVHPIGPIASNIFLDIEF